MVKITRKGTRVQGQLLEYIGKEGYYPHSTSDLALQLGYSWHTVQLYCFELLLKGKIDRLVIGGSHVWMKKGSYSANGNAASKPNPDAETVTSEYHAVQKNQLKEQVLNHFAEKQLTTKIDEAIDILLDQEINRTFKDLQTHLKKNSNNKERKQKQEKQEEKLYESK